MKIHEYQAKELIARYGVKIPRGHVAFTAEEAHKIYDEFKFSKAVVKAQIHAGGRGKGGGVKVSSNKSEFTEHLFQILGMNLVTKQTEPSGKIVKKVLVEEVVPIEKELYLSIIVNRTKASISMIGSREGGVEIEEIAANHPEKIITLDVDWLPVLPPFMGRKMATLLGVKSEKINDASKFFAGLFKAFIENDCSLVELNPLVITRDGSLLALDAKVTFDDNALIRHPSHSDLRDFDEEDEKEIHASKYDLNYISLDGTIGCMVNGAGLAMATMDIIKIHGGSPANFLDVGGGATLERVREAFKIIVSDKRVKAIFINIFGGIMKCDIIARGIVEAAADLSLSVPLVVRLEGTNVAEGKKILQASKLKIISAEGMKDGACKAVEAAR